MRRLITLDPEKCTGCQACIAACGFHHSGHKEFNPGLSSTHISRDNDTAKITQSIDSTCDKCREEDIPLCVKYCAYGARGVITR